MADDNFKRPDKIDYDTPDQESFDPREEEDTPLATEFDEQDNVESTAAIVVEEYTRTIEFMKFVEQLLRDASKVEVEIDPQDDPEVWMAMNRIFNNPHPTLNQDSYFQVIDALEVIEKIEQIEDRPEEGNVIDNLDEEVDESEIKDSDFQISAKDEIEERSKVRRASAFIDPPPPPPPPEPPEPTPWKRRWRKFQRVIDVLGRPYKVQWLKDRWWHDRRK